MDVFDLQAKISLDTSGFEKSLSRAASGMQGLVTKAELFARAIYDIGTKAAEAFGDIAESIIKVGAGFDSAMANVAAISGATGDDLDALRDKAKEMGAETKFSASEAADAFGYMAMAGWKTEDMLDGIDGIMQLAAASGEDLATTSDIVTDALTAFGLSAEDAGHFADVLAAASSNANTNVSMMGETFKYIAPLAGTLGYSAEDVAVAVGLMANSGIKAGQAGTSLRAALSSLLEPTEKTKDLMRDLGLIVTDTIQVLDNDKISTQQGKVASSTANLNKKQIAYNEAVSKYGAESSKAQKAMIDLEEAQRKAGVENDKLSKLMGGSTQVVDLYNAAVTDASGNSLSLSQTIDILRDTFEKLTDTEQASAAAQLFGREAMSGMMAIINAAPADITKLEGAVGNAAGAAQSMAAIMQDNVSGAWDEFTSAVEGAQIAIYETFSDDLQDRILFAADGVSRLTAAFEEGGAAGAMGEVVTILSELTGFDLSGVVDAFSGIGKAFADIKTAFSEGGVSGGFEAIVGQIEQLTGLDLSGVTEAFTTFGDAVGEIVGAFADSGITGGIDTLVQAFDKLTGIDLTGIVDGITNFLAAFLGTDSAALTSIGNAIDAIINAFDIEDLGAVITAAADGLGRFLGKIGNIADSAIAFVAEIIAQLVRDFEDLLPGIIGAATAIGTFIVVVEGMQIISGIPALLTAAGTAINGFSTIFGALNAVMSANPIGLVIGLIAGLTAAFATAMATNNEFRENVVSVFTVIKNTVVTVVERIKTLIDSLTQKIEAAIQKISGALASVREMASDFVDAGKDLIQGLTNGITEKINEIGGGIKDAAGKVVDWFDGVFDRHSPSKVFAEMGRDLMRGLALGIDDESLNVQRTIDGLRFKSPDIVMKSNISVADSTLGRLSAAAINNAIHLSGSGNGQPANINLVVDGRTLASVMYDPMNNIIRQKGVPLGAW